MFYLKFSKSDYTASNTGMTVNNELERKRKEAVLSEFKPVLRNYPGGIEESHERNLRQDSRGLGKVIVGISFCGGRDALTSSNFVCLRVNFSEFLCYVYFHV